MTQQRWLGAIKNLGCVGCHQLGQLSTRTIPASLGTFASGADAWHRRVQSALGVPFLPCTSADVYDEGFCALPGA